MSTLTPGVAISSLDYTNAGVILGQQCVFSTTLVDAQPITTGVFAALEVAVADVNVGRLLYAPTPLTSPYDVDVACLTDASVVNNALLDFAINALLGEAGQEVSLTILPVTLNQKNVNLTNVLALPELGIELIAKACHGSAVTYYLRGYNPITEQFEFWSSMGIADVSGATHLQGVVIVGVV